MHAVCVDLDQRERDRSARVASPRPRAIHARRRRRTPSKDASRESAADARRNELVALLHHSRSRSGNRLMEESAEAAGRFVALAPASRRRVTRRAANTSLAAPTAARGAVARAHRNGIRPAAEQIRRAKSARSPSRTPAGVAGRCAASGRRASARSTTRCACNNGHPPSPCRCRRPPAALSGARAASRSSATGRPSANRSARAPAAHWRSWTPRVFVEPQAALLPASPQYSSSLLASPSRSATRSS